MTKEESKLIKTVKASKELRESIANELGKTENGVYQMALYRPHVLLKSAAAMRVINEHLTKATA